MKKFIKDWFTFGQADLFGDLLRMAFPFAILLWILIRLFFV
jgi:hypothetical protein